MYILYMYITNNTWLSYGVVPQSMALRRDMMRKPHETLYKWQMFHICVSLLESVTNNLIHGCD
jgi:hypothetical protein